MTTKASMFIAGGAALLLASSLAAHAAGCGVRSSPMTPGDIAFADRDYAKAESLYATELAAGSDNDRIHDALIRAELHQSKMADAEKDALTWAAAQPNNAWALVAVSEVRWREGRPDEALRILDQARSTDYCNPQEHADLAGIYRLRAMYASANRELTLARRFDPIDPQIQGAWIRLQPRNVQLAEVTDYLDHATSLSDAERKSLAQRKDRLSQPVTSSCHLASPVSSTSIPFHGIQNGPNAAVFWGLEVGVNGTKRRLEIDTGASGLILYKAAAAALHLEPEHTAKAWGIGDAGKVDSYVAKVNSIKIGDLEFKDCYVEVIDKPHEQGEGDDPGDGLIGGDVFSSFVLTLDFPGRTLKLDPLPARPGDVAAAPSLQTGIASDAAEPEDSYRDSSMKDWTPILRSGHMLIIPVALNSPKGPWRLFVLDTGAQVELISPDAAREVSKISKGADIDVYGISGKVNKEYTTRPMKLYFANLAAPNNGMVAIDTSRWGRDAGVEISGFIGAPTLHQLTFSIDYRDNLVHFTYDPKRISRCVAGIKMADCY